ncbi:protein [Escherichia coli]|uniref:Protein n=1 Tax=Escherichia coli TaxID=562 RepID=A0A484X3A1_ECOLX|nr:protein [Escherichia coli]
MMMEISMSWGLTLLDLSVPKVKKKLENWFRGLTQSATGKDPEITITTWEEWNSNRK